MLTPLCPTIVRRMKLQLPPVGLALILMAATAGNLSAGALYLDGNSSYVTFVGTGIPSGGQSFTIEAWINPTSIPTGGANGGTITFWGNEGVTGQANGFRLRGPTNTKRCCTREQRRRCATGRLTSRYTMA